MTVKQISWRLGPVWFLNVFGLRHIPIRKGAFRRKDPMARSMLAEGAP